MKQFCELVWIRKSRSDNIILLYISFAGTSIWNESKVQGGQVHYRALSHDKGQWLGLKGKSSALFMTFSKVASPPLKGFQSSFLIPCTSHRCATLSLCTALPTIACDALSLCSFFPAITTTRVQIFLVQSLVVLRHGISECMGCMLVCGHLGDVVTHVRACGMLKWVLRLKPYQWALNFQ